MNFDDIIADLEQADSEMYGMYTGQIDSDGDLWSQAYGRVQSLEELMNMELAEMDDDYDDYEDWDR